MSLWQKFHLTNPLEFVDPALHEPDLQGWGYDDPIFGTIIRNLQPKTIIEVGSWKGASAIRMAKECDADILCIDTWLGSAENYERFDKDNKWLYEALRLKNGFPSVYDTFAANIVREVGRERVCPLALPASIASRLLRSVGFKSDLIYIDGSHDYEDCRDDLRHYWPLLNEGGVIFGDDYNYWPGVTAAVDEFFKQKIVKRDGKYAARYAGELWGDVQ